jgi:citrate synthase
MLISIGKPENVPEFIEQVKRREKVLSGFGHRCATLPTDRRTIPDGPCAHRVYKTTDPRSTIVRKTADEVFKVLVLSHFLGGNAFLIPDL